MKPSMMSVAESDDDEEEKDEVPVGADAASTFMATTKGLSQTSLTFGKSIHNSSFRQARRSTIGSVEMHLAAMEMPKKNRLAKKKAEREEKKAKLAEEKAAREAAEAAGIKLPKKAKASKYAYPQPEPLPPPKALTVAEAMADARSWNAANVIANKFSAGTLTTAGYQEKASIFKRMNP